MRPGSTRTASTVPGICSEFTWAFQAGTVLQIPVSSRDLTGPTIPGEGEIVPPGFPGQTELKCLLKGAILRLEPGAEILR